MGLCAVLVLSLFIIYCRVGIHTRSLLSRIEKYVHQRERERRREGERERGREEERRGEERRGEERREGGSKGGWEGGMDNVVVLSLFVIYCHVGIRSRSSSEAYGTRVESK